MRFSTLIAGVFAAASTVHASPLAARTTASDEVAGSVVTNTSVTYYMNHLYDAKTFANKINGYYPRPLTYEVKAGFTCIFYLEATRGVGSPIGQFAGPTTGIFKDWVMAYKCWPGTPSVSEGIVDARNDLAIAAPRTCGWAHNHGNDDGDLECGLENDSPREFLNNGTSYEADSYGIFEKVTCRFFIKKGSPIEIKDLASGNFDGRVATHYLCWRSPSIIAATPATVSARNNPTDATAPADLKGCARVNVPGYGKIDLFCGEKRHWLNLFPKNGADNYAVAKGATCRFWVGNELLPDVKGPVEGDFGGKLATECKCWFN